MSVRFQGAAGRLAADVVGDWSAPAVLMLHGGGQTRHSWGDTAARLGGAGFFVVSLDLRGHGDSDWASDGDYSLSALAEDVRMVATAISRPLSIVGASVGGLAGLIATGEPPGVDCRALALVDIVARYKPDGAARIQRFMTAHPDGFASVDEAAASVAAYLPHRPRPPDDSGLLRNLRLRFGRYHWHWDPALLTSHRGPGKEPPERYEQAARQLAIPVMVLRGELSDIVDSQAAEEFQACIPHAEVIEVADATHMVAGDRNDAFTAHVLRFLQRSQLAPAPHRQDSIDG